MRSFWIAFGGLVLVLWLGEVTHWDLWVQDRFFDFQSKTWLVKKQAYWPNLIFYTGAKVAIVLVGCGVVLAWLLTWKMAVLLPYRLPLTLLMLSLILVPGLLAGAKNITNVHCPWSLERYGGQVPHVTPFRSYPPDFKSERPGKCFPAGHPTGGFAFMMLYYVFRTPKARLAGLWFGLILGWVMGLYQMFKGAHYLSHVLVSMGGAWMIIWLIRYGIMRAGFIYR